MPSTNSPPMTLAEQIAAHEGFHSTPYDDATGCRLKARDTVQGTVTFGFGFTSVAADEATEMLSRRVGLMFDALRKRFPEIDHLSSNRARVLVDMAYNLGLEGLLKFHGMFEAISRQDWKRTAHEMLDSKWAKQVGRRALTLARMMESDVSFELARRYTA